MGYDLFLDDTHLAIEFPYIAEQVAEVKRIPGAKWDRANKLWRFPVSSVTEVRDFAAAHSYTISDEVLRFTRPDHRVDTSAVTLGTDGFIHIMFPYDRVKIGSVKQIPGVT